MIHSENKPKNLTNEERIKNNELASKISFHINNFLSIRKNYSQISSHSESSLLELTLTMAQMCPDLYTIYNFRRELLMKNFLNISENKEKETILIQELGLINLLLKKHQKSYSLFTHRQWTILQLLGIEENMEESKIIKQELDFCEKLLEKDERNFHVWNYRNWLVMNSGNKILFKRELDFTMKKIEQNFSNFSALHFRAKNIIREYLTKEKQNDKNSVLDIPLEFIASELEILHTGLYMQPDEQGIWQYHKWLIDKTLPNYVKSVHFEDFNEEFFHILLVFNKKCTGINKNILKLLINDHNEEFSVEKVSKGNYSKLHILKISKVLLKNNEESIICLKFKNVIKDDNNENLKTDHFKDEDSLNGILENEFIINLKIENEKMKIINLKKNYDIVNFQFGEHLRKQEKNIVDEILTLEGDNKFVLLQKNYLLDFEYDFKELNEKISISQEIKQNFDFLKTKYNAQQIMFQNYSNFYEIRICFLKKIDPTTKFELEQIQNMNLDPIITEFLQSGLKMKLNSQFEVFLNYIDF